MKNRKWKNREWLLSQNEYDLLCRMNDNINHDEVCIMDALNAYTVERCGKHFQCKDCIADWLNEERR